MTPLRLTVAQNVANLYVEPDTASGLATQAVLGAVVTVEEAQGDFCRVATEDRYSGWVARNLLIAPGSVSDFPTSTITTLFADVFSVPDARSEIVTKLVVGTRVALSRRAGVGDWVPVSLPGGDGGYIHSVSLTQSYENNLESELGTLQTRLPRAELGAALGRLAAENAQRFVGTPYLWGGTTPFGIDCSGLTQLAYKLNGIQLLRDARLQFADRRFVRVEEGSALGAAIFEPGDLAAFSRREGKQPTHIGIALGDGRFVHARGGRGVRFDDCDTPEYEETYVGAVRLSADADYAVEAA